MRLCPAISIIFHRGTITVWNDFTEDKLHIGVFDWRWPPAEVLTGRTCVMKRWILRNVADTKRPWPSARRVDFAIKDRRLSKVSDVRIWNCHTYTQTHYVKIHTAALRITVVRAQIWYSMLSIPGLVRTTQLDPGTSETVAPNPTLCLDGC